MFTPHLISGQLHLVVVVLTATRVGAWRDTRPDAASSTSTVEQEPGARLFPQPRPATPMSSDLASHVVRLRIVRILVLPADDSEGPVRLWYLAPARRAASSARRIVCMVPRVIRMHPDASTAPTRTTPTALGPLRPAGVASG